MGHLRNGIAFALLVLPAATCIPQLTMLDVPPTAWAGRDFAVSVWGTQVGPSTSPGAVGCVLQLPIGVTVVDFVASDPSAIVGRDDPTILSLFTVEPGYHLASFDAVSGSPDAGLTARLRAPGTLPAASHIKVALVSKPFGTWSTPQGSFALIGGSQQMPVTLTNEPPTMVEASGGLPDLKFTAAGDVDGDGDDEILGTTNDGTEVWTCHWNGSTWNATSFTVSIGANLGTCATGDFDGDGNLDLALAGRALFGDGLGGWVHGPTLPYGGTLASPLARVAVGDVDADGFDDIAITSTIDGVARVYRCNGNRTFTSWSAGLPASPSRSMQFVEAPLLVDVTGDGYADLIAYDRYQGLVVYIGNGLGQWSGSTGLPAAIEGQVGVGRLSAGATPSLVAAAASAGMTGVQVLSYAGGNLWNSTFYALQTGVPVGVHLEDFDGDGVSDVVIVESGPNSTHRAPRLRLFRTAAGPTFVEDAGAGLSSFARLLKLSSGDFDGDGWPDLAGADDRYGAAFAWHSTSLGAHRFGEGCSSSSLSPSVSPVGQPQLGNLAFAVQLTGAQANTWSFAWFGFDNRIAFGTTPLPFGLTAAGAPGCLLLVDPLASRALHVGPQGQASWPLPLPPDPALHRAVIYSQSATLAPGGNALGILFSSGLAIRVD